MKLKRPLEGREKLTLMKLVMYEREMRLPPDVFHVDRLLELAIGAEDFTRMVGPGDLAWSKFAHDQHQWTRLAEYVEQLQAAIDFGPEGPYQTLAELYCTVPKFGAPETPAA